MLTKHSPFASLLIVAVLIGNAWGQAAKAKFIELPVPNTATAKVFYKTDKKSVRANARKESTLARAVRSGFASAQISQSELSTWLKEYYLVQFARVANVGTLAGKRIKLLSYLRTSRDKGGHDYLRDFLFTEMQPLVVGNYHPGVRYNAILLIGSLNDTEARGSGSNKAAEIPLANALTYLLAQYGDQKAPQAVRIGALLGVMRHVRLSRNKNYNIPGPQTTQILNQMVQVLKTDPKQNTLMSPAVHGWLKRRAIDVLAFNGQLGNNNTYFTAVESLIGDTNQLYSVRCSAAHALSQFRYPANNAKIDGPAIAKKVASLTVEVLRAQLATIEKREKEDTDKKKSKLGNFGGGGGAGGGGFGGAGAGGGAGPGGGAGGGGFGGAGAGGGAGPGGGAGGGGFGGAGAGGGAGGGGFGGTQGGAGGGFSGGGGFGNLGGKKKKKKKKGKKEDDLPKELREKLNLALRRIKYPLYCAQMAYYGTDLPRRAPAGATPPAPTEGIAVVGQKTPQQKKAITDLYTKIEDVMAATDGDYKDIPSLVEAVKQKVNSLALLAPPALKKKTGATKPKRPRIPGAKSTTKKKRPRIPGKK